MFTSPELSISLIVLSGALLSWIISKICRVGAREPYLPPGPPTTLILGNVNVFPTVWPWLRFTEWAREHGEIYSLKIGPETAIVITGVEAVKELMDKRSAATADRPKSYMADAITNGLNMAMGRYSEEWRALRKTAHIILSPSAIENHLPIQRAEATQLMYDLLISPEGLSSHIRRYSNSVIMSVLFGKRCPRFESRETTAFFEAQHLWNAALDPCTYPAVNVLPILGYIPERWAPWKRFAQLVRQKQRSLYFSLIDECEQRVRKGEENGCYMESVLARQQEFQLTREMTGYLGGVLLEGGSDTTASFLQTLVLLLAAYPSVQQKAQREIDAVVGHDRLPCLDDISNLPYIQALIKETHRFRPVVPVFPHASLTTEEYCGFIIPKGTTIFVNIYGVFHSPDYFDDPETFNPDRFLSHEYGTKPGVDAANFRSSLAFGCGRRICPGMNLANNSLMLNTMNLLWASDFKPPKGPDGRDLPLDLNNFEKGILYVPGPFDCLVIPRNDRVVDMISQEFRNASETFSKFEKDLSPEDREWVENPRSGRHGN